MNKKKITKALSLTAGLLFSMNSLAASTFKMAVGDGGGSTQEALGKKFSELLSEKTNKKYSARLFVNGQLGSEQATVNDVALGTLDMSVVGSSNLAPFSPSMGLFALPYIFENIDQAETVINSDVSERLAEQALKQANVRVLAWSYSGFRMLTNSKRPVTTLDDLQGLVIRVPKSEIIIDTYKALGVNPTPVAWSETFTALQQGVVDGQETPYAAISSMKFAEIQRYLTETHYLFQLEPLIMSESLYQDLSPAVQKALVESGKEATQFSLEWLKEREGSIKKDLTKNYGLQISQLEDESVWVKKAQATVWPKFYDQIGGKEKVNQLLRVLGRTEI